MMTAMHRNFIVFAVFGIFLASISQSVCVAEARQKETNRIAGEASRSHSFVRRQASGSIDEVTTNTPGVKTRHLTGNIECLLWELVIDFEDGVDAEDWICSVPGDNSDVNEEMVIVEAGGVDINEYLESNGAVSGKTVMILSEAVVSGNSIIIEIDWVVALEKYDPKPATSEILSRRGLAKNSGTLNTLVVRVNALDNVPIGTATEISADVFNDTYCLKSQYDRCSYGDMQIQEYGPDSSIYNESVVPSAPGVIDIFVDLNSEEVERADMRVAANAKTQEMFGVAELDSMFDLVLFCMPPGGSAYIAYAYRNRWDSYYYNDWCQQLSAIMHEVGHNIGLHHSGEYTGSDSNQEYGDKSGYMGYSMKGDDTPEMCFNPANNWQLGWYSDKQMEINVDTDLSENPTTYTLNGFVDYQNTTSGANVVMKVGDFFYLGFNKATSFNMGTREAANQVTVHEKLGTPESSTKTKLLDKLDVGDEYTFPVNGFVSVKVRYTQNTNGKDAVIELTKIIGDPILCEGDNGVHLRVDLTTDNYPAETSWHINDSNGQAVVIKTDFGAIGTYIEIVQNLCMGEEYTFVIEDQYGDGICCRWGNGRYQGWIQETNEILFSGDEFGSMEEVSFVIPHSAPNPTGAPTGTPTGTPTDAPTRSPTSSPTGSPTNSPTHSPTGSPTNSPTNSPTASPTDSPTHSPTGSPTDSPTHYPTGSPTNSPTNSPTVSPTNSPTDSPTGSPTNSPTGSPTHSPTDSPTDSPTGSPTNSPTASPTDSPTHSPTGSPTDSPTYYPTGSPTNSPTNSPTGSPTHSPTGSPTDSPTNLPTGSPTNSPTDSPTGSPTNSPTDSPTGSPTNSPTNSPTGSPTHSPTGSPTDSPTNSPTGSPTNSPTDSPTGSPTNSPTDSPTGSPTNSPTNSPTVSPTHSPTGSPTNSPTDSPTGSPTNSPTDSPTGSPTNSPTDSPTGSPTNSPTASPTDSPTGSPTGSPTHSPTNSPTNSPTVSPADSPTDVPTNSPTASPTTVPTESPTASPTALPTESPTASPTASPTGSPTGPPTGSPTGSPTAPPTGSPTGSPTAPPTGSPTAPPTGSPTAPPTGSPTGSPTSGSPTMACVDTPDDEWGRLGNDEKHCSWLRRKSNSKILNLCRRRANPKPDKTKIFYYCKKTCHDAGNTDACPHLN